MKLFKKQQTPLSLRVKFFVFIFLMGFAINVVSSFLTESPRQRLNNIILNSNDSLVMDQLMTSWYVNFNKYQDSGMDMNDADRKANLKAIRTFKNFKSQ